MSDGYTKKKLNKNIIPSNLVTGCTSEWCNSEGGEGGFNGFNYVLDSINTFSWLGHFSNFGTFCSIVWVLELVPGDTWSTSGEFWYLTMTYCPIANPFTSFSSTRVALLFEKMFQWVDNRAFIILELQWYNLTLAWWFWVIKVCQQVSKISKICLFGCLTGWATFWKGNFENYSRYSLIKWYLLLSI